MKRNSIERFQSSQQLRSKAHWQPPRDDIVLYSAYGANGTAILEGRVIDHEQLEPASANDSSFANLRRNLRTLLNQERQHLDVLAWSAHRQWHARTDAEGYFEIELNNLGGIAAGWHPLRARAGDADDEIGLLMVPPENTFGVISDIDDTILVTEVSSKRRMLLNTLLRNPLQRQAVPGIAAAYRQLMARNPRPTAAPMFYLSATPRQLHLALQAFLDHNGLPPGVLITKRITNDSTSEPFLDQLAYKTAKLEQILRRVPHVTFTLIGDDTESDPEIFASIRERYPGRIDSIWIRKVSVPPRTAVLGQGDLADLLMKYSEKK